jgi:hypothetical protein
MVNLGCLFALEPRPASTSFEIAKGLTPKRMTEFGANHSIFKSLVDQAADIPDEARGGALAEQLLRSIDVLDISPWQRGKLVELGLTTVGDVLKASEQKLMEASYVGNVRARQMRNAAVAAVLEYLSG